MNKKNELKQNKLVNGEREQEVHMNETRKFTYMNKKFKSTRIKAK